MANARAYYDLATITALKSFIVQVASVQKDEGTNSSKPIICLTVTNTLAYYDPAKIMALKSLIVLAPALQQDEGRNSSKPILFLTRFSSNNIFLDAGPSKNWLFSE